MSLKLFALEERCFQRFQHILFLRSQLIRILRIYRREVCISQRIFTVSELYSPFLKVYFIKEKSVLKAVFRMSHYPLAFHLELTYRYSFIHSCCKQIIYRIEFVFIKSLRLKEFTVIIAEASLNEDFSYLENTIFSVEREKKYKTNKHVFIAMKEL